MEKALVVSLLVVRGLYVLSYPILSEGDGFYYFHLMLLPFRSSLIHAPGYPFLFSWAGWLDRAFSMNAGEILRIVQHLFVIMAWVGFFKVAKRVVPVGVAFAVAFL